MLRRILQHGRQNGGAISVLQWRSFTSESGLSAQRFFSKCFDKTPAFAVPASKIKVLKDPAEFYSQLKVCHSPLRKSLLVELRSHEVGRHLNREISLKAYMQLAIVSSEQRRLGQGQDCAGIAVPWSGPP
jgi:hypothetical protein